jgi:hypothetical protein
MEQHLASCSLASTTDPCHHSRMHGINKQLFERRAFTLATMKYEGSCQCGSVKIGLLTDPAIKYNCHCSHCRKFASAYSKEEQPYQAACAVWSWTVCVEGDLDYTYTVGCKGLFSLARGRCAKCKDPMVERGGRAAIAFSMVVAKPLKIQPDLNLYYDSGWKQGPNNLSVTIYSDLGSFLYEMWLILIHAIPQIPYSLYIWMFGDKTLAGKKD